MIQTIKELLKPPFKADGGKIKGQEDYPYLTAFYKNLAQGLNHDDTYLEWISEALNEKYERDFTEPMWWKSEGRWENHNEYFVCPVCEYGLDFEGNYCPNCGQRLLPSEEL